MNSTKSSPKRGDRNSYKPVTPFDMFYQLTYMSAMASAGISRSKTFEIAALSKCSAALYFEAVNTLVDEFRYDYPDACHIVAPKAKSENIRSFLLRMADAMRSGEPLDEFLAREAKVQGDDYRNEYERNLENLKQWTNAFSSITISVGLIIIIQMITSMIYSTSVTSIATLVAAGVLMAGFGTWIIYRSAPREAMNLSAAHGSRDQRLALRLFKTIVPTTALAACHAADPRRQRRLGAVGRGGLPAAGRHRQLDQRPAHQQERRRVQHAAALDGRHGDLQRHDAQASADQDRPVLVPRPARRRPALGHSLNGADRS